MNKIQNRKPISLGKQRGLQQCADPKGVFNILALDHRRVVLDAFKDSGSPKDVYTNAVAFKQEIIQALTPAASAFLLDPIYGAGPALAQGVFPVGRGLIVSVEETGYLGQSTARISRIAEYWNVGKIKRMAASAVKLLVYYHPASSTRAAMQELIINVAGDCQKYDIPLFLELLIYSPGENKLSSPQRREAILRSVEELSPLGADILKVEFPVDIQTDKEEITWSDACRELSQVSQIPWVLLSAAVDYEVFAHQTTIVCQSGASGVLAGRAIWKEALETNHMDRGEFLRHIALQRMVALGDICRKFARSYMEFFSPNPMDENWQKDYSGYS